MSEPMGRPLSRPRVVVTEFMDEGALAALDADVLYDPALVDDRAATLAAVADADGIIVRNRTRVDAGLLAAAPRLRCVGRLGVGLDNIDLAACDARGVSVHPATGANAASRSSSRRWGFSSRRSSGPAWGGGGCRRSPGSASA